MSDDGPTRVGGGPTRQAWVIEALRVLADDGIDAVRVERLASRLGVSKAPFYWRFKDRAALLGAMLDYWNDELTRDLIDEAARQDTPRARLAALVDLSLEETSHGLDVSRVEGAIRAWAAQDPDVARFASQVDERRVRHVAGQLRALGAGEDEAARLATGIYLALIGLYTVRRYTPHLASDAAFAAVVEAAVTGLDARRADPA